MSDLPTPGEGNAIKQRRKALGWTRKDLAERAGIDTRVVQLLELDQWHKGEESGRVLAVLMRAEGGETDVVLPPMEVPQGTPIQKAGGPVAEA